MIPRALWALALAGLMALSPVHLAAQGSAAPLREGDRVQLRVADDSAFGGPLLVEPGVVLRVPGSGLLQLAGVPADSVAARVRQLLAQRFRFDDIGVQIHRRVVVGGDVLQPGVYYVEPFVTVREAVALAGGVTEVGRTDRVELLRDGDVRALNDWRLGAAGSTVMSSGDVLSIPRQSWLLRNALNAFSSLMLLASTILVATR